MSQTHGEAMAPKSTFRSEGRLANRAGRPVAGLFCISCVPIYSRFRSKSCECFKNLMKRCRPPASRLCSLRKQAEKIRKSNNGYLLKIL